LVWLAYNLAERGGFFYPASSITQLIGHNLWQNAVVFFHTACSTTQKQEHNREEEHNREGRDPRLVSGFITP
jgi:hypothetical protein